MSSRQDDHMDDAEFDAEFAGFLRGEGELAGLMRQVPQPQPSSELDEKILANAGAALAQPASANDAAMPAAERRPAEVRRTSRDIARFLRRARAPLGLAATVVIAVSLGVQWRQEPEVAEQVVVPAVPELKADAPPPPASADRPAPAADAAMAAPPKQEAAQPAPALKQAGTMQPARKREAHANLAEARPQDAPPQTAFAYSRVQEPGTLSKQAALPAADLQGIVPAGDPKAGEWLLKIDELIRQGRKEEALKSWEDFRKAWPDYPVPEPLKEKIKALAP